MPSTELGVAMTPADRRISELIDKWLSSVELHLQYAELSDAAYARVQPWPKHDRPTRWVLDVARQKIIELKTQCENRIELGDSKFAESLELMAFLANLVGIQHIQRFIPLADKPSDGKSGNTNIESPTVIRPPGGRTAASSTDDSTREMPRLTAAVTPAPSPAPAAVRAIAPGVRKESLKPAATTKKPTGPAAASAVSQATEGIAVGATDINSKIIADAVRLLKWGKPWHELAELIGRIADRPAVPDIRKVLRAHKVDIEARAAKSS
jgi:hypothetical protein